jgi:plasmid maintenance system antidote protein VapI
MKTQIEISRATCIEASYWMRLQLSYELQRAERENREAIRHIRKASAPAA